ncbi:uncharacterized protein LOC116433540 isoform X2 [Nomia melanderi]|uniref:uncharacterized protein LOC116433540 isoform X2 n=1 Tax=Nomia melanderi TaxID=2448451 RepID=UPI0013046371|nr:cylicin-1-like isoform X2 [Nomia melanderi]
MRDERRRNIQRQQDATVTSERGSAKSGSKRYSPFQRESSRKDSRAEEQTVIMTSSDSLHSISGGIIESGIKYIMFPLHLLRFCLFGINSVSGKLTAPKKDQEATDSTTNSKEKETKEKKTSDKEDKYAKDDGTTDRRSKEDSKEHQGNSESGSHSKTENEELDERDSKKRRKSDDEEFKDACVRIEDDSDSSNDQWSSASSTMIMNMSLDHDNIDKCTTFSALEEPMDVSIEELIYEKPHTVTQSSRNGYSVENMFNSTPWFYGEEDSNLSVDEEIARIFQKQCTSSEEENSYSHSKTSSKRDKAKENNFLSHRKRNGSAGALDSKKPEEVDKERRRKTPSDIVYTKRKASQDYDRNEKHRDRKNDAKPREEKRSSRQEPSSKSKTKSSKSPVKHKESKRKDVKYKEIATQTDSAFSDDDVEMVPVDMKLLEKQFYCKSAAHRSHPNLYQNREMEHDLNYVADNEDSTDGLTRNTRLRISSCSTSSSSTDLGFDEQVSATPDADMRTGRWNGNAADTINPFRICSRAPPGFPELPQNPPLSYKPTDWEEFKLTSSINNYCTPTVPTSGTVPRAPSPMRHLYYDYPEFMDLPHIVKSSNISNNITSNYYR